MEGWGEIISVYLLPEYTGQGFGRLLLDHAIRFLCQKGYCRIYLWVLEKNDRARRFYEKNGFQPSCDVQCENIGGRDVQKIKYVWQMPN